eukprot:scaffold1112_cov116-Isochrysis_galbana.AAC.29
MMRLSKGGLFVNCYSGKLRVSLLCVCSAPRSACRNDSSCHCARCLHCQTLQAANLCAAVVKAAAESARRRARLAWRPPRGMQDIATQSWPPRSCPHLTRRRSRCDAECLWRRVLPM